MKTKPKNLRIFYFSGTGNARKTAHWILKKAEDHKLVPEAIDIAKLPSRKSADVAANEAIGIISPTHGFNFPPIMFHFILRLPRSKQNQVFILNTRAGMKIGKVFLPGLSGMAQYFTALVLIFKGYKINGMRGIDLPSNWISLHPGLKKSVIDSLFTRRRAEVEKFADQIFAGRKDFRALFDLIQDLLITPVAILYYFFGRFVLAKTFVASGHCNHCGLCSKECPVNAIKTIDDRPYWTYSCESCMHCMNRCPQRAIETAHGYLFLLILLVNSVILFQLNRLTDYESIFSRFHSTMLIKTLHILLFTAVLFALQVITYRLIHYLMRFKFIEQLVIYTSLTKYKFWRRYKQPKQ